MTTVLMIAAAAVVGTLIGSLLSAMANGKE